MKRKIYIKVRGGLGDVVLSTPIYEALKIKYPSAEIIALCSSQAKADILKNNPFINKLRIISSLDKILIRLKSIKPLWIEYSYSRPSFSYFHKKAQEIIGDMVGVVLEKPALQIYLDETEDEYAKRVLSEFINPVIIHITSITTENQMWPIENWNELVKVATNYTFIQLGMLSEAKVAGAIDLRGKTTIRQSMAFVKHAKSFVGVVSFLAHVTNAFDKPGVVFFGPSSSSVWGHDNNLNLTKNLPCAPCVDAIVGSICPYGKPCMSMISVQEVQQAIEKQITS